MGLFVVWDFIEKIKQRVGAFRHEGGLAWIAK